MAVASPYATWTGFFDVEYRVNGLWLRLLSDKFPNKFFGVGSWSIGPEGYYDPEDTKSQMADWLVSKIANVAAGSGERITTWPYVYYEGKSKKGDSWTKVNEQVKKFAEQANAGNAMWVVSARGDEVRFWAYNANGSNLLQEVVLSAANVPQVAAAPDQAFARNITTPDGYRQAIVMLDHMKANFTKDANGMVTIALGMRP